MILRSLPRAAHREGVRVELGPGNNPQAEGAIGVDRSFDSAAHVLADLERGLGLFADSSINEMHCHHTFEHIDNLDQLLLECYRVLRPGGVLVGSVPHFSNPYFYSDPTHRRTFGLYTIAYYCDGCELRREVPRYVPIGFQCRDLRIKFISPFQFRGKVKKVIERLVNTSTATMEFYEENLCFIVPAFELAFRLEKPV
jgi:ubiquinone/menaquinone biosynthesis C-methylase UbiE